MTYKVQSTISIDDEVRDVAKLMALQDKLSFSSIVEQALIEYITGKWVPIGAKAYRPPYDVALNVASNKEMIEAKRQALIDAQPPEKKPFKYIYEKREERAEDEIDLNTLSIR